MLTNRLVRRRHIHERIQFRRPIIILLHNRRQLRYLVIIRRDGRVDERREKEGLHFAHITFRIIPSATVLISTLIPLHYLLLLLVQSIVPNMKFRNNSFPLFLLLAGTSAFAPLQAHNHARSLQTSAPQNAAFVLQSAETDTDTEASNATGPNSLITVPVTFNEMIRDSSNAMR